MKRHPDCDGTIRRLCSEECDYCYDKSLASKALLDTWSSKNKMTPRQIFKGTHTKYIFICTKKGCGHEYETSPRKNTRCPYCCKSGRKLCSDKKCKICIGSSFDKHPRSKFWSSKNEGKPSDYTMKTTQKFLFDCPDCKHEFPVRLSHITKDGRWCPYCAIPSKKVCQDENCEPCFNRSFESCEKSLCWSSKNSDKPRDCLLFAHKKRIFDCDKCNREFEMNLYSVAAGRWCPSCKRKTETKLHDWLQERYKNVKREIRFDWCKKKQELPYDFALLDHYILIELDGAQHFKQVLNWQAPEITQLQDRFKEAMANKNGFTVIRLLQEEVLSDQGNWEELLTNSINRIRPMPTITLLERSQEIDMTYITKFEFE